MRPRRPIVCVVVLGAALLVGAAPAPQSDIYLLAGQSNMSGRGLVSELSAGEQLPDPRISMLGNNGIFRVAREPLDDAAGQVNAVSADRQAAVGPGLFFARAMLARHKRPVLLVPCAKGGSSIRRWAPGSGRDTLYGSCLARARQAGGRIVGILWYQGETDAENIEAAAMWGDRFTEMVNALRRDLGQPKLPVVYVQLADHASAPERAARFPGWRTVQEGQAAVRLPCARMVTAAGLPLNPDELHLSTSAHRLLGPKLAQAMSGLQRKGCR